MADQKMLMLKDKLGVRAADMGLFYAFYRYLNLLFSDNEGLRRHASKGLIVRRVDCLYSYAVDLYLSAFKGDVSDVNLNCSYDRFSYFDEKDAGKVIFNLFSGREIFLQRYLRGLAGRGGIYNFLRAHGCRDATELWNKIIADHALRYETNLLISKLSFLFEKIGAKRVFAIDFSDSLNLIALYAAKSVGVKVIIVPHGCIQDFSELYTYGHLADGYICWSRTEAQNIFELMGGRVSAEYFGCPLYSKRYVEYFSKVWLYSSNKRAAKNVVLFCNPIYGAKREEEYKGVIKWVNSFVKGIGFGFQVKLHQRDALIDMELYFKGEGIDIAEGPVEDILLTADLVLGFQTTVLYQAAVLNVSSLQLLLDGGPCFKFDLVEQVSVDAGALSAALLTRLSSNSCFSSNNGLDQEAVRKYANEL